MLRRRVRRSSFLVVGVSLSALAACGGMVVVDGTGDHGDGGAPADAAPPPIDARMDAKPLPPDSGSDAAPACDDSSVCSWDLNHDGTCIGAASVGDFCDFLATPCSSMPPDCDAIGAIVGAPAQLASCGDGTSFCDVDFTGNLSATTLDALCSAHAASGQPLDCILD
jgi:hypothetical protein